MMPMEEPPPDTQKPMVETRLAAASFVFLKIEHGLSDSRRESSDDVLGSIIEPLVNSPTNSLIGLSIPG
ncbi:MULTISPECIES: hypothetical protein [Pseudomonas]|uniref:hypothetical protein n=1 Tax=Pseudomonas TaxID=286 RepID=UPI0006B5CD29|nr:hypothetical protein [Pseudomonas fuscovaginae]